MPAVVGIREQTWAEGDAAAMVSSFRYGRKGAMCNEYGMHSRFIIVVAVVL